MVRWVGRFQLYQTSAATTDQFQVDDLWEYYEGGDEEEEEDGIDWWWPEEGSSWSVWIEEVGLTELNRVSSSYEWMGWPRLVGSSLINESDNN